MFPLSEQVRTPPISAKPSTHSPAHPACLPADGADTNVRNASGITPLLLAIAQRDNETVTALLK
jgi:ankyrin repeat protein